MTFFRRGIIICIRLYQKCSSKLWRGHCIYTPTCSEYGIEAIRRFGVFRGVIAACLRIIRCTPGLYAGGNDPVQEHFSIMRLVRALRPNKKQRG